MKPSIHLRRGFGGETGYVMSWNRLNQIYAQLTSKTKLHWQNPHF